MHLFFYDCIIILFDPWFFHYLFFYSYVLLFFYSIPLFFYSSIPLFFKSTIYTTRNNIKHGLSHVAKVLAARSSRHSGPHPKLTPLRAIDLLIARAGPKRKGVGQTTLREILWELCRAISGDSPGILRSRQESSKIVKNCQESSSIKRKELARRFCTESCGDCAGRFQTNRQESPRIFKNRQ